MAAVKSSAVAAVASEMGYAEAHSGGAGEISGQPDLLGAFEEELTLFEGQAVRPPPRRGPGRPAGSVNRTTRQLQGWLTARGYRDPAEFLAALVTADTKDLARELGVEDRIEVLKVQRAAAVDLMPYFHQRQGPIEAERPRADVPIVMIFDGSGPIATRAGDLAMSVNEAQQYQGHGDIDMPPSHDEASHDEG